VVVVVVVVGKAVVVDVLVDVVLDVDVVVVAQSPTEITWPKLPETVYVSIPFE
jgi:hypothetical protein